MLGRDCVQLQIALQESDSIAPQRWFCQQYLPPAIAFHVTEGAVHHTGKELSGGNKDDDDGDQLASHVRGRHLGDVHGESHGGHAWWEEFLPQ